MQLHIVDGTYELFRAHFGAPPGVDASGRQVGAVRGLVRSLASLLTAPHVSHVAVAFDSVLESFRNQLFAGYKAGEGLPEELIGQFELAERSAAALGLASFGMREFEADDALATLAARFADAPEVERILLCSPDKDVAQCVSGDRVVGFDRMRDKLLDEAGVVAKFGVLPASIPDWLALVGDDADGIPGLPRWGVKGAAAVLARYRHLEAIPDEAPRWDVKVRGASALAKVLAERREDARLYRKLATLRTDVPLEADLRSLAWRGPTAELGPLLDELGMRRRVLESLTAATERCLGAAG
jgi:5'-3' exonuclease